MNFTREYTDQEKATVAQFRAGQLVNVMIPDLFDSGGQCRVVQQFREVTAKNSNRLCVGKSPTAAAYFVTHDDNYSMTNGSGYTVITATL